MREHPELNKRLSASFHHQELLEIFKVVLSGYAFVFQDLVPHSEICFFASVASPFQGNERNILVLLALLASLIWMVCG